MIILNLKLKNGLRYVLHPTENIFQQILLICLRQGQFRETFSEAKDILLLVDDAVITKIVLRASFDLAFSFKTDQDI